MISLKQMLDYGWDIDEEDTCLEEWDEDVPAAFGVYLNYKKDRQYWITLSISTREWTLTNAALWFQPEGELGMRILRTSSTASPGFDSRFIGWLHKPEQYKDE
jgi:hypothetical protein